MHFDSKQELLKFIKSYCSFFKLYLFKKELKEMEYRLSSFSNIEYRYTAYSPQIIPDHSNKTFINQKVILTPPKISIMAITKINSKAHTLEHHLWYIPISEKFRDKCLLEYGFDKKKYTWISNTKDKFITHHKINYKTEV